MIDNCDDTSFPSGSGNAMSFTKLACREANCYVQQEDVDAAKLVTNRRSSKQIAYLVECRLCLCNLNFLLSR